MSQKGKREQNRNIWNGNSKESSKVNARHNLQSQEAQKIPSKINTPSPTTRCIIFKPQKIEVKEKNFREPRGTRLPAYRRERIKIIADFLSETTQERRKCSEIFKGLKKNLHQTRILYLTVLLCTSERKILSQTNKKLEISLPADLLCNECFIKFCKQEKKWYRLNTESA